MKSKKVSRLKLTFVFIPKKLQENEENHTDNGARRP